MQSAGLAEYVLSGTRAFGERLDQRGRHLERSIHVRRAQHALDRLERRVSADSAARSRIEIALQARRIVRGALGQLDAHDVADRAADPAVGDVCAAADDAFAVQEPDGELDVLAGRAHGDRYRRAGPGLTRRSDPDLERLLDHDEVLARTQAVVAHRVDRHFTNRLFLSLDAHRDLTMLALAAGGGLRPAARAATTGRRGLA